MRVSNIRAISAGERSPDRTNKRNGYREPGTPGWEPWSWRSPKLRSGSYFPSWLLESRRRAERALVAVVAECCVPGVSTRRVEGLVQTLGIESISKSQVSQMAKSLDQVVESFRTGSIRWIGDHRACVELGARPKDLRY